MSEFLLFRTSFQGGRWVGVPAISPSIRHLPRGFDCWNENKTNSRWEFLPPVGKSFLIININVFDALEVKIFSYHSRVAF